jgi:predicted dehydrogenase
MTTGNPVRVGFIGTGWTERVQIPIFRLGGLTAQAICSGNPANAQRVAHTLSIPDVHEDWRELIQSDRVDLVSIVTPPHLHREIAVAALQAGKHVICEKPTALNVAEAEAMLAAAQAAPNQLAIIDHELRFHPQRIHLRQLIKEEYVGTVLAINITIHSGGRLDPARPWGWWSDAARGGGILGAMGSHMLDLCRWLNGKIDSLAATLQIGQLYRTEAATGIRQQVTADDYAQLLLRFANGAQGSITVSGLTPGPTQAEVLILGTRGALRLDPQDRLWGVQGAAMKDGAWQQIENNFSDHLPPGVPAEPFPTGTYFLARLLAENLSQGNTTIPDAASFYDGLAVQRALDAARRSHRERAWVTV